MLVQPIGVFRAEGEARIGWAPCSAEVTVSAAIDGEIRLLSKRRGQNLLQRLKPQETTDWWPWRLPHIHTPTAPIAAGVRLPGRGPVAGVGEGGRGGEQSDGEQAVVQGHYPTLCPWSFA
jgi:hypothetical protein